MIFSDQSEIKFSEKVPALYRSKLSKQAAALKWLKNQVSSIVVRGEESSPNWESSRDKDLRSPK